MTAHDLTHTLWRVSPWLEFLAIGRFSFCGLARRYPCFVGLLIYDAASTLVLSSTLFSTGADYAFAWALVQPVLWILMAASVFEVFDQVIESYPRIGAFAHSVFFGACLFAVISGVSSGLVLQPQRHQLWFVLVHQVGRAVNWGLSFLMLGQALVFVWVPVPMRRNLRLHRRLLLGWLTVTATSMFLISPRFRDWRNLVLQAAVNLLMGGWIVGLSRHGEREPLGDSRLTPAELERLNADFDLAGQLTRKALEV